MFKRISVANRALKTNSFTNSHVKIRKLENMKSEQNNGSLSNSYMVKFCKESIIKQNNINIKG